MKTNAILLLALMLSLTAEAQTINVYLKSGEIVKYSQEELDYMDYTEEELPPLANSFVEELSDDYSIFKSIIQSYEELSSESFDGTILLFSNEVINNALENAHARLNVWNHETFNLGHMVQENGAYQPVLGCPDAAIMGWIADVALFSQRYTAEQMQNEEACDLTSIRSQQWRTNVQKVDAANPVNLLNAVAYDVSELRIPNNVLIYRLKDVFSLYEDCTDEQKTVYFNASNLSFNSVDTEISAWTPLEGVWPLHENRVLRYNKPSGLSDAEGFSLDFTPITHDATGQVSPYPIPPGSYRLAMGFIQNSNITVTVTVYANGQEIAKSDNIELGSSTVYHYDRGTALSPRYPEYYDPDNVRAMGGNSKAANYDTDGGLIIDEVVVPDLNGDGTPVQLTMHIACTDWAWKTNVKLHHWCLRPTSNNY